MKKLPKLTHAKILASATILNFLNSAVFAALCAVYGNPHKDILIVFILIWCCFIGLNVFYLWDFYQDQKKISDNNLRLIQTQIDHISNDIYDYQDADQSLNYQAANSVY